MVAEDAEPPAVAGPRRRHRWRCGRGRRRARWGGAGAGEAWRSTSASPSRPSRSRVARAGGRARRGSARVAAVLLQVEGDQRLDHARGRRRRGRRGRPGGRPAAGPCRGSRRGRRRRGPTGRPGRSAGPAGRTAGRARAGRAGRRAGRRRGRLHGEAASTSPAWPGNRARYSCGLGVLAAPAAVGQLQRQQLAEQDADGLGPATARRCVLDPGPAAGLPGRLEPVARLVHAARHRGRGRARSPVGPIGRSCVASLRPRERGSAAASARPSARRSPASRRSPRWCTPPTSRGPRRAARSAPGRRAAAGTVRRAGRPAPGSAPGR